MKCSRCGSRYPNPGCYVCRDTEQPAPETPDHEEGHLLQEVMKPEQLEALKYALLIGGGAVIGWKTYKMPWWASMLLVVPFVLAVRGIIELFKP